MIKKNEHETIKNEVLREGMIEFDKRTRERKDSDVPTAEDIGVLLSAMGSYFASDLEWHEMRIYHFIRRIAYNQIKDNDFFYIDPHLDGLSEFVSTYVCNSDKRDACLHIIDHIRSTTLS